MYVCGSCGEGFSKWSGKCPACAAYNALSEFREARLVTATGSPNISPSSVQRSWLAPNAGTQLRLAPLSEFSSASSAAVSLGSVELDRLLGGRGLTLGSSTLFSGAPGVGKSTLLLQVAGLLCGARREGGQRYADFFSGALPVASGGAAAPAAGAAARTVAYISGEESAAQLKGRADRLRLDCPGLMVLNETKLEDVLTQLGAAYDQCTRPGSQAQLSAVIVDSIQTLWTEGLESIAGSVGQVKECALKLTAFAKATGVPVVMVGHVNKSGDIAGPRVLEHIVDAVLYMEGAEEMEATGGVGGGGGGGASLSSAAGAAAAPSHGHRVVRALKNRYGSTSEVALLQLGEGGFTEAQPAQLFLSASGAAAEPAVGCAITVTAEGSRPLCVEVQALVQRASGAYPRARACGVSLDRLHLVSAVLAKHTRVGSSTGLLACDTLVNVVGGLRLSDPSFELALALALASTAVGLPLPREAVFLGEVGLTGELRGAVPKLRERLVAARALGFTLAFVPRSVASQVGALGDSLRAGFHIQPSATLGEVVQACFPELPTRMRRAAGRGG